MTNNPKSNFTPEFMDRISTTSEDELVITKVDKSEKSFLGERMNDMSSIKVLIDGKWVLLDDKNNK